MSQDLRMQLIWQGEDRVQAKVLWQEGAWNIPRIEDQCLAFREQEEGKGRGYTQQGLLEQ